MKRWDPISSYHLRKQIKKKTKKQEKQTIGRPTNIALVDLVTRDMHVQNIAAYYIIQRFSDLFANSHYPIRFIQTITKSYQTNVRGKRTVHI